MDLGESAAMCGEHNLPEDAERALLRLEACVDTLSCADAAREALCTIRHALYVAHFHAHTDALTGLMNRNCFDHAIAPALARAERAREPGALLFIDLDDFKLVNDDLGHAVGDEVLAVVAMRLREAVRSGDIAARYGGDEFVAYLDNVCPERARAIAERIIAHIEQPCATSAGQRRVTPSVGIALYPAHGHCAAELLRYADSAMYRAKGHGGAGCAFYGEDSADHGLSGVPEAFHSGVLPHERSLDVQPRSRIG
jgi:diguanylate cyclase (GGDEF)-like protein